ncbi:MAG: hypothetical protein M3023_02835 [Pseudomonadota bacterium]|nr:hypothetical protein [Pseudomonadota bacterium]
MISRLLVATLLIVATGGAHAQPAPAPSALVIPPNKCVKPEYPGKLANAQRFNAFNKDFNAYGECIKKYVDDTKAILNAAAAAANGAVEEFNKFAADIKAQDEGAKN